MPSAPLHVVTGAYGFSGRHIARRLLARGYRVRTLTNAARPDDVLGRTVEPVPYRFDDPAQMAESLRGADVLYNTYWVRFTYGSFSHAAAVHNTEALLQAARIARVGRIVHVSITNPSEDSDLEYFRGKAVLERRLRETGIPATILRPAVLFGKGDILINNIAWLVRRLPIFGIFGDGSYKLQPIHVDDLARLAVGEGEQTGQRLLDAIGPETFTYRELVLTIANILRKRPRLISLPPEAGYAIGWILGKVVGDVIITRDEIEGLMRNLLFTPSAPAGTTKLTEWLRANAGTIGTRYASELARRR